MGIMDFIKKIFVEDEIKEVEKEKIKFSEIGNWTSNKREEVEIREGKVFDLIAERTNIFIDELQKKVYVLGAFDLESKKADERIVSATEEGRKKYIGAVNIFIDSLNKVEKKDFGKFGKSIDKLFLNFNKSSYRSYERGTILIGKEMADVKETLKVFSKDLIKIFWENKDIVDSLKTFSIIELKLKKIAGIDEELEKIKKSIEQLDNDLIDKEKENKKILDEIEDVKKSKEYIKNLVKWNNVKFLEGELEKDILGLKQIIDFKALANFYHIFEDKMNLVKGYREDFKNRFEKDEGEIVLTSLLSEAKLDDKNILEKMQKIKEKKEEIDMVKKEIKVCATDELYSHATKIILDINHLKNEKMRLEKRAENLGVEEKELKENVEDLVDRNLK